MSDEPEGSWGAGLSWSFGGLVAVYFGFPALWIWPISKVYGWPGPDWVMILTVPHVLLAYAIPWYQTWVNWGLALFGII
jgi:hypothetical protein